MGVLRCPYRHVSFQSVAVALIVCIGAARRPNEPLDTDSHDGNRDAVDNMAVTQIIQFRCGSGVMLGRIRR